ncbi:MAG: hypothetical protein CMO81_02265 [Waddliaceae bacterium]|nr:hypothetical protein [Waddliaceae bacterium]
MIFSKTQHLLLLFILCYSWHDRVDAAYQEIDWITNWTEAKKEAETTNKAILVSFSGSDWCGWCMKLEHEVFASEEFIEQTKDQLVFVSVDFPRHTALPAEQQKHNYDLLKKYGVRGFPTVLLLNNDGETITVTGYREGGGSAYAEFLLDHLSQYRQLDETVQKLEKEESDAAQLRSLYERTRDQGHKHLSQSILKHGLKSAKNLFFKTERYQELLESGLAEGEEAQSLRKAILSENSDDADECHYRIAVSDFSKLHNEDPNSLENNLAPLKDYLERFGNKESAFVWKVNMTIAQLSLSDGKLEEALHYAESSLKSAPSERKEDIEHAIEAIKYRIAETTESKDLLPTNSF